MKRFEWSEPHTLEEALAQIGPDRIPKAGAVDLMDLLKERLIEPARLVNVRRLPGLDGIQDRGAEGVRVGPNVTLAALAEDSVVRARYRALADAAAHAATPQIRNMATTAGNLMQRPHCWYFRSERFPCRRKGGLECFAQHGENRYHAVFAHSACAAVHPSSLATALLALGGSVELTSPRGVRVVPLEQFFTPAAVVTIHDTVRRDDELVTGILLPASTATSAYGKHAEKESYDWPLVEVAVALEREGGRCTRASVVLGAVAPVPWRARAAESALAGRAIDDASAVEAGKQASRDAAPLRDNGYKVPLIEIVVRRAVLAAVEAS